MHYTSLRTWHAHHLEPTTRGFNQFCTIHKSNRPLQLSQLICFVFSCSLCFPPLHLDSSTQNSSDQPIDQLSAQFPSNQPVYSNPIHSPPHLANQSYFSSHSISSFNIHIPILTPIIFLSFSVTSSALSIISTFYSPDTFPIDTSAQSSVTTIATSIYMPARGESFTPTFDSTKPQELPRFFDEIKYLISQSTISDEIDKKRHVLYYVDFEIAQTWRCLPEFANPSSFYIDFKKAILYFYHEASGDSIYSLSDLQSLFNKYQLIGITSIINLSSYHLQFIAITSWLIDNHQLDILEQKQTYICVFQPQLLARIIDWLHIKKPDHHPNIPYLIKDVYEAAQFILRKSIDLTHILHNPPSWTIVRVK